MKTAVEAYIRERDARDSRRSGRAVRSDAGLKAALNGAYAAHRARLGGAFPTIIKHGLKAAPGDEDDFVPVARDNQILTDAKIGSLLTAAQEIDVEQEWEGDLFRFVVVLAATGARFSQIARMRVGDVQSGNNRLMVPVSRKGKGKAGSIATPVGKDVLDALQPAVSSRKIDAPLLERWRHKQEKGSIKWHRDGRGPWFNASELVRPWGAVRQRAEMPDVIPHALRHSSIVRGIKANLPLRLVAAMHDTSVAMIERHYAKWIVSGLEELAARAVVPLIPEASESIIDVAKRRI